ncbi:phosphoadenylyl-sulfate reductase [Longispora albida]|uniref:phosphoadenylyl-sulfate reductase n=1 Tax=Longispora albida TaxID=203523 RepID=UPI000A0644D9|nr:phosphoadenylyl-sulfate reductase [Longispora albida]
MTPLEELAYRAGNDLEEASAERIVEWAVENFGERFCVTSSFADALLAHLVSRVAPGVDVIFLDTGLHFAETLAVRDLAARTLPITVRSIPPQRTVGQQDGDHGPRLFHRDPGQCCTLRKVKPLESALAPYTAWATGLRRDETPSRAGTPVVGYDYDREKVKISPLARWTAQDAADYITRFDVPVNDLINQGYPSVGCWPCTRAVAEGEDPRSGRWAMFEDKTECGIHL